MNKIILTPSFKKAYKKFVKRFPFLKIKIDESIRLLEANIYDPKLQTHKLSGELFGSLACSCGYDCRIVFYFDGLQESKDGKIILITIGTHDEVY
ncbi:MAG: type II toxin-antitoxin system mRNA interferase toxin, RelE/StbE family [Ignavibacteria bacterium]|nr:type II toxin-antitoxin system mRNA interferase toxin, RelE/StbE family [Ignavibacteria bacterium]